VEKIELVIAICQGLNYAHTRGIVHRDIKPANVMVCTGGGVKIVDFGIAHFGDKNVTRTGQIVGSISYMSPEQVNGRQVDARTDIFSTGVVLYQLFTYALPFEGESTASTLLKIIHEPPPPLKDFLASYPPQLQTIVDRALAKDRNERYASAEEFALDLGQLQSQLKQEMIHRYLQEATQLIEGNDLHRAKGQVMQILKIDRHHSKASHLLRDLQEKIQRQEIDEEIQQLRLQAEDAFGQKQYATALEHLDRAISLD
jgi:serine/threonine protein kinase